MEFDVALRLVLEGKMRTARLDEHHGGVARDVVVRVEPPAGTSVTLNDVVVLVVATGREAAQENER